MSKIKATLSDHFNGRNFFNPEGSPRGLRKILAWLLTRKPKRWPRVDIEQKKIVHKHAKKSEIWVTFINHSTVLLQMNGWNILTDPIWSERASPFSWLGPKRVHKPGIKFEDLPPIDIVLVSHNHYDHMDIATLKKLQAYHKPQFYVGKGDKIYLKKYGITNVTELDWWDSIPLSEDHTLFYVPAKHFSSRGILDRNKTLWGGFAIKNESELIYFAGDTAYGSHFKEIHRRLGAPTLSILPIGAFKPHKLLKPVHMAPWESVEAFLDLKTGKALSIHFGTFQLTDEDYEEPAQELEKALNQYQLSFEDFWVLKPGEGRRVK